MYRLFLGKKYYVDAMYLSQYLAGSAAILTLAIAPLGASAATFTATLEGGQVVSPNFADGVPSAARGTATFELSDDLTSLAYEIQLDGVVLKANIENRTEGSDVTKIHIHQGDRGVNGPHVLNIFGLPSEDDADLAVDFGNGILTGLWTDEDAFDENGVLFDPTGEGTTKQLSSVLDQLQAGDLYLQIHTNNFDGLELRGQITPVPEPAMTLGLAAVAGLSFYTRRRKSV